MLPDTTKVRMIDLRRVTYSCGDRALLTEALTRANFQFRAPDPDGAAFVSHRDLSLFLTRAKCIDHIPIDLILHCNRRMQDGVQREK